MVDTERNIYFSTGMEARVAHVFRDSPARRIILNRGSGDGWTAGSLVYVPIRPMLVIQDPTTGEPIAYTDDAQPLFTVVAVRKSFLIADLDPEDLAPDIALSHIQPDSPAYRVEGFNSATGNGTLVVIDVASTPPVPESGTAQALARQSITSLTASQYVSQLSGSKDPR